MAKFRFEDEGAAGDNVFGVDQARDSWDPTSLFSWSKSSSTAVDSMVRDFPRCVLHTMYAKFSMPALGVYVKLLLRHGLSDGDTEVVAVRPTRCVIPARQTLCMSVVSRKLGRNDA